MYRTSGNKIRILHDALMQRDGGVNAFHDEHIQGAPHAGEGFGTVPPVSNQFRHQRIVERGNHVIGDKPRCPRECRCLPVY